jgi:hypothetical protein
MLASRALQSYSVLTGEAANTDLGASPLTGMARDGSFLYTMDSNRNLRADISFGECWPATRSASSWRRQMFVGDGSLQ